jgi:hypothetical protein
MKLTRRMSWLRVSVPGWILHFLFSLYKVRVHLFVSIVQLLTPFDQLSRHQEAQPGCRPFQNILFKATIHYPLTSVLIVLGHHHDHHLILKAECQK